MRFHDNRLPKQPLPNPLLPKPPLKVLLCSPRGFCAGVVRAIDTVERALAMYGKPVYVRHEIVHNRYVVESLRQKGAVFVEELDEIPDTTAPVVFSAHGVPKSVPEEASRRNFVAIDATCPLVTKVHREAEIHFRRGREIMLIGHAGHPEVIGTMGQLPPGAVRLVQTAEEAATFVPARPGQARLCDADDAFGRRHRRDRRGAQGSASRSIAGPHKEDICYATTNRQEAVKQVAPVVDAMIVVGSPNSSNSQRLKEVAVRNGCPHARAAAARRRHRLGQVRRHRAARHHGRRLRPRGAGRGDHRRLRGALRGQRRDRLGGRGMACSSRCRARCAAAARRPSSLGNRRASGPAMAVYTDVTDEELQQFLAGYDLGDLLSYKGIAEGVENSNFLLHTAAGSFILTLYEKRVAAADLPFFLGLMEHLAARGLTCPQPVRSRGGEALGPSRQPPGRDRHLSRRHVDQAAERGPLRRGRRGARASCISPGADFAHDAAQRRFRSRAGAPLFEAAASRADTRAGRACARRSRPSSRSSNATGRATCRTASSMPICFPTTCSFSAIACRA